MTDEAPYDADAIAKESWETEFEAEMGAEVYRREALLSILAAVLRATHDRANLALPIVNVFADATMRWLALKDPLFFDAAREDMAEALGAEVPPEASWNGGVGISAQEAEFIAQLLQRAPPSRRGPAGDATGRNILILALLEIAGDFVPSKQAGRAVVPEGEVNLAALDPASGAARAEWLHKELREHKALFDLPDAVPDEEVLRTLWRRRQDFIAKARPPSDWQDIGWSLVQFLRC